MSQRLPLPLAEFVLSQLAHRDDGDDNDVDCDTRGGRSVSHSPQEGVNIREDGKVFNDPVHGHLYLPALACDVVDTPQFQRLRDVKQLGTTHMVFPGATHTRFEHSLGTGWLASSMFNRFHAAQQRELGLERHDGRVVALAGLCHDLGHGPFSHVFDNEFMPRRSVHSFIKFEHEQMSASMLEHLVDDCNIDIDRDLVRDAQQLITAEGEQHHTTATSIDENGDCNGQLVSQPSKHRPAFLSEIVANKRNSVDVDKFDYIQRDTLYCGLKQSCDFSRMMKFCRVIGDEICYKTTEVHNLYELFHSRASLHQRVYSHPKGKGIEFMVADAMTYADSAWDNSISSATQRPEDFCRIDDTVLKQIELSREPELQPARDIVSRIRRRDLYRFVNEFTVPTEYLNDFTPPREEDITQCQRQNNIVQLEPQDIVVNNLKIDWAMKGQNKNPCDFVKFFKAAGSKDKFHIDRDKVSSLYPTTFLDRKVRVYSKKNDPDSIKAVSEAFEEYQLRSFSSTRQPAEHTPRKRKRPTSSSEYTQNVVSNNGSLSHRLSSM
jgi:HD superfamily phosphohydrolase